MSASLSPDDYQLLDRYLDAVTRALRKTSDCLPVRRNLRRLIEMVAEGDDSFRNHMTETILEIQDA